MNIFPKVAAKYISDSDNVPMTRFGDFVRESLQLNETWWVAANLDQRYEAGDQQLWNQYYNAWQVRSNKQFTFNLIRPQVSMFEGYQRANRKSTIAVPRQNATQEGADQFSELLLWIDKQQDFGETFSSACRGSLITGMSLVQNWMDFRKDPINGEIKYTNCPYNSVIVDPYFTKLDFSDCRGIVKRSFVTPLEAASYLPNHYNEIVNMDGFGPAEATFQFMPQNYQFAYNNLLTYDEFYYPAMRTQKLIVDTKTGDTAEWRKDDDDALREFLATFPELKLIKQEIPTTQLSILVQGKVLFDAAQPNGCDTMPFTPCVTYYNPELEDFTLRCAGIVRSLRDPQFLFNHRKVLELQSNESVVNAGWLVEEDAVVNPDDLYKPNPGQVIYAKRGKLGNIQKILPTPIDPTWLQSSQDIKDLMPFISNATETMMGQSTDAISGYHETMKTANSIVANQRIFDQWDSAQRIIGRKTIEMIQNNWTPGKIKKILKKEPVPEFYDKTFGEYDCEVELGFNTATQKQMQFMQLLELQRIGLPIPATSLIEAATLQKKNDLLKTMEAQQQQQQQMQQQQQQLEMLKLQAEINVTSGLADAQRGKAAELVSRINENEAAAVERRAEAAADQQRGVLDLVKAMREIQNIDLDQMMKVLELGRTVREIQKEDINETKREEAAQREVAEERERAIAEQQQQVTEGQGAPQG